MFNTHFANAWDRRLFHLFASCVRILSIFKLNKCESAKACFDPLHLTDIAKRLIQ